MHRLLVVSGYDVLVTADGREAIELFRTLVEDGIELGAIVTDLDMPRLDGVALIRLVRAERPQLPVICITANTFVGADAARRTELESLDRCRILAKPFRGEELVTLIASLLGGDG
ncbi:MAG: response regulator [Gemmatimonadaceae bacterium]|nr:response regulator [Gemmatimonadaceae bacterium]